MPRMATILIATEFFWLASVSPTQTISVGDPYNGDYSPRAKQLVLNEAKLTVTLKMDRAVYFIGESAEVTIALANPTPGVLEIRDPSDHRGPFLDLMTKDPKWISILGSEWGSRGTLGCTYHPKHPDPPSVFVPAGHAVERRFRAHEKLSGATSSVLPGGVPEIPGEYRLAYVYSQSNRAVASFEVVQPRVVTYALVTSPRTEPYTKFDKSTVQLKRSTFVLAFEGDGAYWVVVGLATAPAYPWIRLDKNGHFVAGTHRMVGQFIRVARSSMPIVAVGGSLDSSENLTVTWQDLSGKTAIVELDANRKPKGIHTAPLP